MQRESARTRILEILELAPELKDIMLSPEPLSAKRRNFVRALHRRMNLTFDENPNIPPLKWVQSRDAIIVLRNILSRRNEKLAGFSFFHYLDDLINRGHASLFRNQDNETSPLPALGFLKEFENLIKCLVGRSGIYGQQIPAFQYSGVKAARLRSSNLSSMAKEVQKTVDHIPTGLSQEAKQRRSTNRTRIQGILKASDKDWQNWKWHLKHIIRHEDTLRSLIKISDGEYEATRLARTNGIPFGITPHYLSLMDNSESRANDYAIRAQVIPTLDYIKTMKEHRDCHEHSLDFMLEQDTSPIEGITRRYPMIAILKPILTCPQICVYCQRNWEIDGVMDASKAISQTKLDKAISWIKETPEISEVLITGGDPLLLSNSKIGEILQKLSKIDHVERIRIGSRTPVTLPQRITDSLLKVISQFHVPGRREVIMITHFEHAYEITPDSMNAVQRFRRAGISVYNQLVFTFFNSRRFEASFLRNQLRLIGVTPYYTFNTKGKDETGDFQVPIARLLQEQKEEARLFPGTVRTDEIVFNVPRLGKNYLRASQHHDIISILPDGRRVYEFHPWEKKLSLVDTYVYTDVSIHEYLKKLKDCGEDINKYKTIWFYY